MPETGVQLNPTFAAQLEKEIQEMKSILQNLKSLVPNLAAAMPITFDLPFFISGAAVTPSVKQMSQSNRIDERVFQQIEKYPESDSPGFCI
jgi:hypothetical protein